MHIKSLYYGAKVVFSFSYMRAARFHSLKLSATLYHLLRYSYCRMVNAFRIKCLVCHDDIMPDDFFTWKKKSKLNSFFLIIHKYDVMESYISLTRLVSFVRSSRVLHWVSLVLGSARIVHIGPRLYIKWILYQIRNQ